MPAFIAKTSCSLRVEVDCARRSKVLKGLPASSFKNSCKCSVRTFTRQTVERMSRNSIFEHSTAAERTGTRPRPIAHSRHNRRRVGEEAGTLRIVAQDGRRLGGFEGNQGQEREAAGPDLRPQAAAR